MYYMVKNFKNINFENYELIKDENWKFSLIIDKNIKIQYVHYRFDKNAKNPYKKDIDIYYSKIWEYIIEKYEIRLSRMKIIKENPIFLFTDWWNRPDTLLSYDKLKKLNDLKKDNIIVAVDKFYPEFTYLKQIERKIPGDKGNGELGKRVYDKFLK